MLPEIGNPYVREEEQKIVANMWKQVFAEYVGHFFRDDENLLLHGSSSFCEF